MNMRARFRRTHIRFRRWLILFLQTTLKNELSMLTFECGLFFSNTITQPPSKTRKYARLVPLPPEGGFFKLYIN